MHCKILTIKKCALKQKVKVRFDKKYLQYTAKTLCMHA